MGTTSYQWRQQKKRGKKLLQSIVEAGYFENCNYHPAKLVEYTWSKWDQSIVGVALTNGGRCSCSIYHCAPSPLSEAVAMEMAEHWRLHSDRGLAVKYGGCTEEDYTEFEKEFG